MSFPAPHPEHPPPSNEAETDATNIHDSPSKKLLKHPNKILEMKRPPGPPPPKRSFPGSTSPNSDPNHYSKRKLQPKCPPPNSAVKDISLLRQTNECPAPFRTEVIKIESNQDLDENIFISEKKDDSDAQKSTNVTKNIHSLDDPPTILQEKKESTTLPADIETKMQTESKVSFAFVKGRRPPPGRPPSQNNSTTSLLRQQFETFRSNDHAENPHVNLNLIKDVGEEDSLTDIDIVPLPRNLGSENIYVEKGPSSDCIANEESSVVELYSSSHQNMDSDIDESVPDPAKRRFSSDLTPGSLWIKCIEASNIRRKDQTITKTVLNPFLVFSLGAEKQSCISGKTCVMHETGQNPSFDNVIVKLNIVDPDKICDTDGSINLKIQLIDCTNFSDTLLGEVDISAVRFLTSNSTKWDEWIPLTEPGDTTSNSKLHLEFQFQQAKAGMIVFTLFQCSKLIQGNEVVEHPYVSVEIGNKMQRRSRTIQAGGANPYFGEEKVLLWVDEDNWFEEMNIKVMNEVIGNHNLVGQRRINLRSYMNQPFDSFSEETISLSLPHPENVQKKLLPSSGNLRMKIEFLEAGDLIVQVVRGKYLREVGNPNHMDPFVLLRTDGSCSSLVRKTAVVKDGSTNPSWEQHLKLPVVDHYTLEIECYNHDTLSDITTLIGKSQFSLLPVFKSGHFETHTQLKFTNEFGVDIDSGQIEIIIDFTGPRGVAYPQHQPGIASFDDSGRDHIDRNKLGDKNILAPDIVMKSQIDNCEINDCGFTNEQIQASFNFLDLDKNGFLGAAEIRHILICMGELVTDEEIDMMISMLDSNGDGQISLDEFSMMVKDPDPARDSFGSSNKMQSADMDVNERKKELESRNQKRKLLSKYVARYQLTISDILLMWKIYQDEPPHKMAEKYVDIDFFCKCLPVDRAGETETMFGLFDKNGSGLVQIRELILSLTNFVPSNSLEKRCESLFEIFDEDRSGFLCFTELEEILVGNHMMGHSMIKKKAQTIMNCADTDGSGGISLQELIVAASKFPNLLFPNHNINSPNET